MDLTVCAKSAPRASLFSVHNGEAEMRQCWQEQSRSSLVNLNLFAPKITHSRQPG